MTIAQQLEENGYEKGYLLGYLTGYLIGYMNGFETGKQQAKLKIAFTMLQKGYDRNTVLEMTGLPEDDLAQMSQ